MESRYERNRIYLNEEEQEIIKNCEIILGGAGIGSVIAECALRLGFEKITIIDGDEVEMSNLNRQNYVEDDVSLNKVEALKNRLKSINRNSTIEVHNCFLNHENVERLTKGHKIAVNALDFSSDIPLVFDQVCKKNNIPVLHPYNLGWAGLVAVIVPDGVDLKAICKEGENFNEISMVEYVSSYLKFWGTPHGWLDDILEEYRNEQPSLSPPQLSIASWQVAAMCTHILFSIATGKNFKKFPDFYLSTLINS